MELLKQLYEIYSPSSWEKIMAEFIVSYVSDIEGAYINTDTFGNIFVTKGEADTYPCVVAHIDQVQQSRCIAFQLGGIFVGLDSETQARPQGLGADDKNGIWICMKLLKELPAIKVAFFVEEEIGSRGSRQCDKAFFENCRFVVECDRKNANDFVVCIGKMTICSDEFINDCRLTEWGYRKEYCGGHTDVKALLDSGVKVSCCNISCGYYEPHTIREYTIIHELHHTLDFVRHICNDCTKTYPHEQDFIFKKKSPHTDSVEHK